MKALKIEENQERLKEEIEGFLKEKLCVKTSIAKAQKINDY